MMALALTCQVAAAGVGGRASWGAAGPRCSTAPGSRVACLLRHRWRPQPRQAGGQALRQGAPRPVLPLQWGALTQ
jgi:hypothetical protein